MKGAIIAPQYKNAYTEEISFKNDSKAYLRSGLCSK
jgi:hypothetical protein